MLSRSYVQYALQDTRSLFDLSILFESSNDGRRLEDANCGVYLQCCYELQGNQMEYLKQARELQQNGHRGRTESPVPLDAARELPQRSLHASFNIHGTNSLCMT